MRLGGIKGRAVVEFESDGRAAVRIYTVANSVEEAEEIEAFLRRALDGERQKPVQVKAKGPKS